MLTQVIIISVYNNSSQKSCHCNSSQSYRHDTQSRIITGKLFFFLTKNRQERKKQYFVKIHTSPSGPRPDAIPSAFSSAFYNKRRSDKYYGQIKSTERIPYMMQTFWITNMFHLFLNSMGFKLLKVWMDIDGDRPSTINTQKAFTSVRRVPTHLSQ